MKAHVDVLTDALGGKSYRVHRMFPDLESAEAGVRAIDAVSVGHVVAEATTVAAPTTLVVDEDAIPGCPSGVCGLD